MRRREFITLLGGASHAIFTRPGPKADILHDLNPSALAPLSGRHRLVRRSTRPGVRLERDVRQCVVVARIPDLAEMIYQQLAAAAALPRRSYRSALLPSMVHLH